jgi:hypothetical protein
MCLDILSAAKLVNLCDIQLVRSIIDNWKRNLCVRIQRAEAISPPTVSPSTAPPFYNIIPAALILPYSLRRYPSETRHKDIRLRYNTFCTHVDTRLD